MEKGTIIVKLSELGKGKFFVRDNVLIVLNKKGQLLICKINTPLTKFELKFLNIDLEIGLRKINDKIQQGAPITMVNGDYDGKIFYDDLLVLRKKEEVITFIIF